MEFYCPDDYRILEIIDETEEIVMVCPGCGKEYIYNTKTEEFLDNIAEIGE